MRTPIWFILLFTLFALPCKAQMASVVANKQIGKLPVLSVHCLLLDSEGYLWYGTVNGLCRDDGYNVQVFRNDYLHPQPLKSNIILSITEDSLHHILFGTPNGAFCIDKSDYKVVPLFPETLGEKSVKTLHTAADGTVFVRTNTEGFIINGQHISEVPIAKVDSVITLAHTVSTNDYLWLMTREEGLVRIDPDSTTSYSYSSSDPCKLIRCSNGTLWCSTMEDIYAYRITPEGQAEAIDLCKELKGYDPQVKTIADMKQDKDGNLWVARYDSESFIIDFEKHKWTKHKVPAIGKLYNNSTLIITLARNTDSSYWMSQNLIGLCLYDLQTERLVDYTEFPTTKDTHLDIVHELIPSSTPHQIWALTESNHVYGVMADNMEMTLTHTIELPNNHFPKTVFEDRDGTLWIGTYRGIYTYDPATRNLKEFNATIGHTTSFTQTVDGTIWATVTRVGVIEISNGKTKCIHAQTTDLLCISSTSDGTIWVGTGTGELLQLVDGKFTSFSEKAGMNGDMVEKIVADKYDHLWILSNQHLTEFDPATSVYRIIKSDSERNSYSLPRFMPRALSLDTLSNEVIAGGFDGFLTCTPSPNITNGTNNIEVRITDLKISNKSVIFDLKKTLCDPLPANAQNIEIQISALDHLHSSVIRYAYRFDDGEWNYLPVGRNSIQIKQFEKGNHTLQIKSTDKNGIWSTNITEFDIFREPYWYETYTAYAIYVILFVLAIFAIIRYFILRTRKQEEAIWSDSAELVEMRRYIDEKPSSNHDSTEGRDQVFTQIDKMLLSKIKETVEQHIGEPDFNVATLADHMNMSRSTLMRKIKVITGKTPLQFIRDIKIESACQMLKNHTTSVSEVAHRLGYTDSDYFSKTFRESVGMSPSEWQRQNLTLEE